MKRRYYETRQKDEKPAGIYFYCRSEFNALDDINEIRSLYEKL